VQAELATNQWISKIGKSPFRLATVHFPVAIGPQLSTRVTSSNMLVHSTIIGEYPFILPMYFNIVDIRDVARAHVLLFEHNKAEGRYIISIDQHSSSKSWLDVSHNILEAEDLKSLPISTFVLPPWVLRLLVWFNIDTRFTAEMAKRAAFGPQCGFDGSKVTRELGFEYKYTDIKVTIHDAARSMVQLGIAEPKSKMPAGWKIIFVQLVVSVALLFPACCHFCFKLIKKKKD